MESLHRDVLRKNRPYLTKNLEMEGLWDYLATRALFKDEMIEKFKSYRTSAEQARMMLTELQTRGPTAYERFLSCLDDSEQSHIKQHLLQSENDISGHTPIQATDNVDNSLSVFQTKGVLDMCVLEMPQEQAEIHRRDSENVYKMVSSPRGLALIINNMNFENKNKNREGSDVDRTNLSNLFKQLGYTVEHKDDLTGQNILKEVNKFLAKREHNNVDSCILVIMSHGKLNVVEGVDDDRVYIDKLIKLYGECRSLLGKPKLFFIQACRGDWEDTGVVVGQPQVKMTSQDPAAASGDTVDAEPYVPPNSAHSLTESVIQDIQMMQQKIPSYADLLIGFSSLPGYVSWRHSKTGSWYIQAVCEVFSHHAHNEDIGSLMTKVNSRVAQTTIRNNANRTLPMLMGMLLKKFFFFTTAAKSS